MRSPYDSFAWFYDRYWTAPFHSWQTAALEQLLFPPLVPGACILDLCCGTGQLANFLVSRGYKVIGVDSSREMLRFARRNAPQASFMESDAAGFTLEHPVDAAVCSFDSLNHLVQAEQVRVALASVHAALKPDGFFVFDVNTASAYGERWNSSACEVHTDDAFFLRGGFDPQTLIATTRITMFRLLESWQRSDVEVHQRPWEVPDIERMLRSAGFNRIGSYRAIEELGMPGHYGIGRVYFHASKGA